MKSLFARHGAPEIVKSDHGPQYSFGEFAKFAKGWCFKRIISGFMYPKSNGLAEKTVQTVKSILTKAQRDNQDPCLAILEERNTLINDIGSPARLSMGRRLRSTMLSSKDQLIPKIVDPEIVQIKLQQKQAQQKKYYDRTSTPLKVLSAGDDVYVQREGKWKPAVVMGKADTPRSFHVKTADGAEYRRNRVHLRKSHDQTWQSSSPEKLIENPPKKEMSTSPIREQQSQHQKHDKSTSEEHYQDTSDSTCGIASPVKTKSGRVIRKSSRYRDCI